MKMLMTEQRSGEFQRDMRQFRTVLNNLMSARGMETWKQLRLAMEETGYVIGQSKLSQYLNGGRNPEEPQELFEGIASALDLTEEEKLRLVYAFAYPESSRSSGKHFSRESKEIAEAFEAELIEEKLSEDAEGKSTDEASGPGV